MRKITKGETLNPKFLYEIAEALNVSVEWLKTGHGSSELSDDLPNNRVRLDLYDVAASCGGGHINPDFPELLYSLEIPRPALKELLGTDNLHGVKLISPDGDSMEPTVPAKSVALIRTDVSDFAAGGVYLFTFQGYTYIKRLSRGKAGVIHVTSDNPIYGKSDFVIEPEEFDDLFIHGKFWKVLPLDFLDI
ncbi:transcriptional regulator [Neisseria meningitidis]|nr:transcriptional regulator [Neisseria meningitidis]